MPREKGMGKWVKRGRKQEAVDFRSMWHPDCKALNSIWPPYLHGHHGQDFHGDSVELIKTAPGTCLSQALVDVVTRLQQNT